MEWLNGETQQSKEHRLYNEWQKWYAWHPVTIGVEKKENIERYKKIWLEYILRQRVHTYSIRGFYYIYKRIEEIE
jgi:hypothetical protein